MDLDNYLLEELATGSNFQKVSINARSCNSSARTGSLHYQGLWVVSFRVKGTNVIRPLSARKGMRLGIGFQFHRDLLVCDVDHPHITQHLPSSVGICHELGLVVIKGRHFLDKRVRQNLSLPTIPIPQGLWNQRFHRHILQGNIHATLTRQNCHLAGHIRSRKVVSWIRFGKSFALGIDNHVGKFHAWLKRVENITQSSRKDAFDRLDSVPRRQQIGSQRPQNGQTRSHGGFITPLGAGSRHGVPALLVTLDVPGPNFFVGRHHVHSLCQPSAVTIANDFTGGRVKHDGMVRTRL
mmetsp:Transcript_41448/g.48330  ORF Transcript_41448/g.48330 Transcript_41448/m.48330 type:complete len:295 (-) Transcript_41448:411-1295(-)